MKRFDFWLLMVVIIASGFLSTLWMNYRFNELIEQTKGIVKSVKEISNACSRIEKR